jgi:hypothetical protein
MKEEEFAQALTMRGLGFYGRDRMKEICENSGIILLDDDSVKITGDPINAISKLIIQFSSGSLIAKMTAQTVAKKYGVKVPDIISIKKESKKI